MYDDSCVTCVCLPWLLVSSSLWSFNDNCSCTQCVPWYGVWICFCLLLQNNSCTNDSFPLSLNCVWYFLWPQLGLMVTQLNHRCYVHRIVCFVTYASILWCMFGFQSLHIRDFKDYISLIEWITIISEYSCGVWPSRNITWRLNISKKRRKLWLMLYLRLCNSTYSDIWILQLDLDFCSFQLPNFFLVCSRIDSLCFIV